MACSFAAGTCPAATVLSASRRKNVPPRPPLSPQRRLPGRLPGRLPDRLPGRLQPFTHSQRALLSAAVATRPHRAGGLPDHAAPPPSAAVRRSAAYRSHRAAWQRCCLSMPFSIQGKHRLKSLLETRWYFVWQGAIFFQAGVDSFVLDCFKKSQASPPNGINQRFSRKEKHRMLL